MRRLQYRPTYILLNPVTYDRVGLAWDAKAGHMKLHFRKEGVILSGGPYNANVAATGTAYPAGYPVKKISYAYTDDGLKQSKLVRIVAPSACEDCNYPYKLTFRKRVKTPGVGNAQTNLYEKSYAGELPITTSTNGYVDELFIRQMQFDLMDMITNDTGQWNSNTNLEENFTGAVVDVYTGFRFPNAPYNGVGASKVITIYNEDGTIAAGPITINGATMIANLTIINDTAAFTALFDAYGVNGDPSTGGVGETCTDGQILIKAKTSGINYYITDSSATSFTYLYREMIMLSKDEDIQFDVIFDNGFAEQEAFWFYVKTAAVGDTAIVLTSDGLTGSAAGNNVALTEVTNINVVLAASLGSRGFACRLTSTGPPTSYSLTAIGRECDSFLMKCNTMANITTSWSGSGVFPSLTADDVFKLFAYIRNQGAYGNLVRLDQPAASGTWAMYTIVTEINDYEQHGAGQNEKYEHTCIILADKTTATTNVFRDPVSGVMWDTTAAAAKTLEEIIGCWADCGKAYWYLANPY